MKKTKLIAFVASALMLASCSTNLHPDYPSDYGDSFFSITGSDGTSISFNLNRRYYQAVGTTNEIALNYLLDQIASELTLGKVNDRDFDNDYKLTDKTLSLYSSDLSDSSATGNDVSTQYITGFNEDKSDFIKKTLTFKGIKGEVTQRNEKAMLDKVTGGSYDTNSRFNEKKFATDLNAEALLNIDTSKLKDANQSTTVLNKTTSFDKAFTADIYNTYMDTVLTPSTVRNMLTAQYIYNERYSSILNAGMRNVDIVALADRSDDKGAAISLINAYMSNLKTNGTIDSQYIDHPLEELAKLWKGIGGYSDKETSGRNASYATNYVTNDFSKSGSEEILSAAEIDFLKKNSISSLYDQILDDLDDIHLDNPLLTDTDKQNTYTGSGAYGLQEGTKRQIDALRKKDIYTTGVYQKTDSSVSSLPAVVTNQLYSSMMENTTSVMESKNGKKYSFVTSATASSSSDYAIYDQSSNTYYVVMLNGDVYGDKNLSKGIYDSDYLGTATENAASDHAEQRAAAMDVAYSLVSTSTFKTDAVVYWLHKYFGNDFTVNNETFYNYLKSTYPNLFPSD